MNRSGDSDAVIYYTLIDATQICIFLLFLVLFFLCMPSSYDTVLVLTSGGLASLELVQIPPTDCQTSLVLIHTPAERVDVLGARTGLRLRGSVDLVLLLELGALG